MVTNAAAGVALALADAVVPQLASIAATAAETPDELEQQALDLAVNDVVAPFLHAGSNTLGNAVASAIARGTGLTQKPPTTPPGQAVVQVEIALQQKLTAELASMRELSTFAAKARLNRNQLAAKLAATIAENLADDLARGLVRLPSSNRLDSPSVTHSAELAAKGRLNPRSAPKPPAPRSYTVQPGDSLWAISKRLLGPGATADEIGQAWQLIYRENHATIGADPNRLVPGQVLRIPIPITPESTLSRAWVLVPWLGVGAGALTGLAIRRRKRSMTGRS